MLLLESDLIFFNCFSEVENSTSSANLKLDKQSACWSPKLMPMLVGSSSSADWSTGLNNRDLRKSPCCVHLPILNTSLSLSVKAVACWSEYNFFRRLMCGVSTSNLAMFRVKCLREVQYHDPHADTPFPALLLEHSVCH